MNERHREHKVFSHWQGRLDLRVMIIGSTRRRKGGRRGPGRGLPRRHRSPGHGDNSRDRDLEFEGKRPSPEYEKVEDVPAPPPPPRISKISIGFQKPKAPIKMTLGTKPTAAPKPTVASVFSADDDEEPEEMPAEARMRMRNIGRETPTSAGPNSFGKTKQGFCDAKKVFEKNLKQALETADKPSSKYPQTIYKIGP